MRHDELERVLEILVAGFDGRTVHQKLENWYGEIGNQPWQQWKCDELIRFREQHPDQILVAEKDGKILGFVSFTLDRQREVGEIQNNAVDPAYQGQGIGSMLYQRVLEVFRREGMKYAWVVTGLGAAYAPARRAYRKVGFEPFHESLTLVQKL
jgi:GNAT superfamily N-acetyltransferase